jgi:hypothetical protein
LTKAASLVAIKKKSTLRPTHTLTFSKSFGHRFLKNKFKDHNFIRIGIGSIVKKRLTFQKVLLGSLWAYS